MEQTQTQFVWAIWAIKGLRGGVQHAVFQWGNALASLQQNQCKRPLARGGELGENFPPNYFKASCLAA